MQLKLDKTVVLVAATKALAVATWGHDIEVLQRYVDILSAPSAKFIQSVIIEKLYEYELIEPYLEEV